MSQWQSPFDPHFHRLIEQQDAASGSEVFADLLKQGSAIIEPLCRFIDRQPDEPRLAVLVELLGKTMDRQTITALVDLLNSDVPEIRRAAANGLGWNHAVQALEALDWLEANDGDARVRQEARAAIEEVLRLFPKQRETLVHHKATNEPGARIAGEHDEVPTGAPDEAQRLRLMAALPRLLALKYRAVPLHISPGDKLHLAVRGGGERYLIAALADLTGLHIELHNWTNDRIQKAIDELYTLGDDDFCTFHAGLTPMARDEVVERVLSGVRPQEPSSPLSESHDAAEAVQFFLSTCCFLRVGLATIHSTPHAMTIVAERGGEQIAELPPPPVPLRERFLCALRLVAGFDPVAGLGPQEGGRIRIALCKPAWIVHVSGDKGIEGEVLRLRFEEQE